MDYFTIKCFIAINFYYDKINLKDDEMKAIQQKDIDTIMSFVNKTRANKMTFDEIHGYIASVVCSPRLIKPSEWLDFIFKQDGKDAVFDSQKELESITGAVFNLYNEINRQMKDNSFDPYIGTFNIDEFENNDPALWCRGFSAGMLLWDYDFEENRESEIINYLIPVIYFIDREKLLEKDLLESPLVDKIEISDMIENMVYYIGPSVILVYEYFNKKSGIKRDSGDKGKTGRNDPCPCGSGKKYKKCCGK